MARRRWQGAVVLSCCGGRRIDCSQRGTGPEARLVAISQILLGQLGKVQTTFQELQDGQAGQATSSFRSKTPRPPKTIRLTQHMETKSLTVTAAAQGQRQRLPCLVNRPICLWISTHSPSSMATADGCDKGFNGASSRNKEREAESLLWLPRWPVIGGATSSSSP
jgi:hypothetical protein